MIIYDKSIDKNDKEKIKEVVDINNIKEEIAVIINGTAYVAVQDEENFIIKKINRVIWGNSSSSELREATGVADLMEQLKFEG